MDLSSVRKEYKLTSLEEGSVEIQPIAQFEKWFHEAVQANVLEANAMMLSTVSLASGRPSARIVLLKEVNPEGFVFFTNYKSKKGVELLENPAACLTFFWPELERQVRIEGFVQKTSLKESDDYFRSRPWDSRIGAWTSLQSSTISSREELEKKFQTLSTQFTAQGDIPTPEFWGGYILKPDHVEFWQGRPNRLHDRILYQKENESWKISRLSP
jgi:pyridoxamine 5'-phosphate oxidase